MSIESLISFFYAVFQPNYYFAKSAKEAGQILLFFCLTIVGQKRAANSVWQYVF